jgi:hypothetical protein
VYDGNAHGASGTAVGVKSESLTGLDLGASFTNVPGGTANWKYTDVTGNYNDKSGTAAIVINKAAPTVVVTPYSVTYDGLAHTATGTAKGVKGETLTGLVLTGTTHTNVGDYPTDPWSIAASTNYNAASGTVHDSIGDYTFTGFTSPVDMLPTVNSVNAGQAIPTKWRLTDANGIGISNPSSFVALRSYPVICGTNTVLDDEIEETWSGNSGLIYKGDGYWQFNWKTPKTYSQSAQKCRNMYVAFNSGKESPEVKFKFK